MPTRSILLTGASGFLGKEINKQLASQFRITSLGLSQSNLKSIDLSVQVPEFHESFDMVIHAAGKAHSVPVDEKQNQVFYSVNVQGTKNLIQGLESSGYLPAEFVFISSVAVYGREEGNLINESHPLLGESPYAQSKIQAEKLLRTWCDENGIRLTILRLPLLVGENPPGNLGSMLKWMNRGLYVGIGMGEARKSMVLAADVAKFVPQVASIGGVFNLTDGYNPTMKELEIALAGCLGKRSPIRLSENIIHWAARVGDYLGSGSPINSMKIKKLINSLTFSDALARGQAGWESKSVIDNLQFHI